MRFYTAAKLGIPDRLADGPRTSAELAEQVGAGADALGRLLRLLAGLGARHRRRRRRVRPDAARGAVRSASGSMRDLAICYGERFYRPLQRSTPAGC